MIQATWLAWPDRPLPMPVNSPKPVLRKIVVGGYSAPGRAWVCISRGHRSREDGWGDTPLQAFDNYRRLNCLGKYARTAPDLAVAARSPSGPGHGSGSAEVESYAKLKRFSRHAIMLPVWLLGLACGLIIAAGIYHGISAG